MTLEVAIVPFDGRPGRAEFDCGIDALNDWLRTNARQHQDRGISRTFLAIPKEGALADWQGAGIEGINDDTMLGFFTLSSAQVFNEGLPAGTRLPRTVPVVRLGRLAVHRRLQRRGLGRMLLMEAIVRAAQVSETIGVTGLFVDAKDESSAAFYRKYGFESTEHDPLKLWLPLASVIALLGG